MSQTAKPKKVCFLLYQGVQLLDVSGPAEVLSQANREAGRQVYDVQYVGRQADGKVMSSAGLQLGIDPLPSANKIHTLVVPGADLPALAQVRADDELMQWLDKAAANAQVTASVCTGAFLLGQLGYLDDHRVTTHWMGTSSLQNEFPRASVEDNTLYVQDDKLWTSAGVLSGVDMMLAMVRLDLGAAVALNIARALVVFLFRDGGQSQFSGPIDLQSKASRADILNLVFWLEAQLHQAVTVEQMAEYLMTSVRTLHRRCLDALDMTPAQILSELRLERSRNLLHQLNLPVKSIAHECGFSNAAAYSKAFRHRFGVAPNRYRQRFSGQTAT
ncbi:MAG: GlxA family transcriptional regulator [Pseudomonadales bacterium]|nr:GlxA family transcriptional regulator [Pseudomonadales bacterium]